MVIGFAEMIVCGDCEEGEGGRREKEMQNERK